MEDLAESVLLREGVEELEAPRARLSLVRKGMVGFLGRVVVVEDVELGFRVGLEGRGERM